MQKPSYRLDELARLLAVDFTGDGALELKGIATLVSATSDQLSFLANPKYQKDLENTGAGAVIVSPEMAAKCPSSCLISSSPYLVYAKASTLFAPHTKIPAGVHPSAVVSASATIDPSACIGPNCTIADEVSIGAGTVLRAGVFVGERTQIGADCSISANVSIYHDVVMGDRVCLHSGVVIGSDGFGYAPAADFNNEGWVKIAQLGGVRIGNDVEIGAGTTVDRGALDDTVIGNRVIIDNQVQIAHNVVIGENTGIAGCAAISGSSKVGRNCTIAGGVGLVGHITLVDGVHVTAMTMVTKSITQPGSYSSGTPMMDTREWKRSAVRFSQLDALSRRLIDLENDKTNTPKNKPDAE